MATSRAAFGRLAFGILAALCAAGMGCQTCRPDPRLCTSPIPRELEKVSLPAYTIAPPDILLIDAVRVVPLPPYRAEPLDILLIQVSGVLDTEPIAGPYPIYPEGTINLGFSYGEVPVVGLSLHEIKEAIEKSLRQKKIKEPNATVSLAQSRGLQQIRGEHLVRPDGTVGLGTYGSVPVAGLTLDEAKAAIEALLSQHLLKPEVSVDVAAYNSKVIYIVFDGGGNGEQLVRLPATGNETVLDALSQVGGLQPISSKHQIWVARPGPACSPRDIVMPVDWIAITTRARTETNYQLLPGDRVYVQAQALVTIDTYIAKFISPFERMFGFTLLGDSLIRQFQTPIPKSATAISTVP